MERPAGQLVELVEQLEHLLLALFAAIELQDVVVLKAQFAGGLVPQGDQFHQVADDHRPDFLAGLPGGPPLGRVARLAQNAADVVVGQFLAVHLGSEHVERPLHGVRLGQHLFQQVRIHLLGQVFEIQDRRFPGQERIGHAALLDGLQLGELLADRRAQIRASLRPPVSSGSPLPCR